MKKKLALIFADIFLMVLSYLGAFVLRFEFEEALDYAHFIYTSLPIIIIVTVPIFIRMGMYRAVWRYASIDSLITTIKAVTFSIIISVVLIFFLQTYRIPRSIFIIYWFLFLVGTGGIRFSPRIFRHYYTLKSKEGRRVLIYGAGTAGQMIAKEMRYEPLLGYTPICFVDDDPAKIGKRLHDLPIYSGTTKLDEIIKENDIEDVLIAVPSTSGDKVRKIIEGCKASRVKFKTLPSLSDIVDGKVSVTQIREIEVEDLLRRAPKDLDQTQIMSFINGKSVMITGAGGTIGSELSRQVVRYSPSIEMLVDNNEYGLYRIDYELYGNHPGVMFHSIMESITKPMKIEDYLRRTKTDIIFHSAAYKHVPLVELNPCEAIINNILGTIKVAKLADKHKVKKVVLISTDKAVRPTNVMGTTKRVCELYIQNFNSMSDTEFVAVRFGNVLDSSGSVIPMFKQQITNGGPVTVTHPEVTRYFMLIPEAVQLVMQAASVGKGGEILILDMGKPVKIVDMAGDMIRMMGFTPEEVKIEYTGLRQGEKLFEELLINETDKKTKYESITVAGITDVNWEEFESDIDELIHFAYEKNVEASIRMLKKLVPEFNPKNELYKTVLEKGARGLRGGGAEE
ncbi:MAG: polysaccharide biosynthesis protein [Candidatus Scalindua sediminis]|nr:polysaccharide biosynthesis protein [Candidatus Scalindua sediminis]